MNQQTLDSIMSIANLIFSIAFSFIFLLVFVVVLIAWILSKKSEQKYKISVINIVIATKKTKDEVLVESIKNAFIAYKNSRYGFGFLDIQTLNARLVSELRDLTFNKYYKNKINSINAAIDIERLNKVIYDSMRSDDKKYEQIIKKIESMAKNDKDKIFIEEIKGNLGMYIESVVSTCNGRIIEKQSLINDYENKMKKMKVSRFFSFLVGAIGIISGILKIISFFK